MKNVRITYDCINTITPLNTTSQNSYGMVVNAFLADVEKWEGLE